MTRSDQGTGATQTPEGEQAAARCPVQHAPAPMTAAGEKPWRSAPRLTWWEMAKFGAAGARDPYGSLWRWAHERGDIVELPIPRMPVFLVTHPDYINHISNRKAMRYTRATPYLADALIPGQPRPLPLRDGDDWKRVRRLMNPMFSEKSLAGLSPQLLAGLRESLDDWAGWADTGEVVELQAPLLEMVMTTVMRSLFSTYPSKQWVAGFVRRANRHGKFIVEGVATIIASQYVPKLRDIPIQRVRWPHLRTGRANMVVLLSELDDFIDERRAHPTEDHDLLNLLLEARFDDGTELSYEELRAELLAFLFAGFETTAMALAWTLGLLFLPQHHQQLRRAYAEVDSLDSVDIGYEHIDQLPYLRACFDEGQRLQGGPAAGRMAKEDDVLDGIFIPQGAHVIYPLYGMHTDPRYWKNPSAFEPSRFLTDEINKYAFLPFGVGPRRCIGMRMGYIDGVAALAMILQRYQLQLPHGWQPKHHLHFSTGLKNLPVTLHTR